MRYLLIFSASLLSLFSFSVFASESYKPNQPIIVRDGTINGMPLDIDSLLFRLSENEQVKNPLAPATGITFFEVIAVGSSNIGWEDISQSQSATLYDHGGSELAVAVLQYGYGNDNNATLNSQSVSSNPRYYVCGSFSNLHICNAGETVTGWLYYYFFNGQQGGAFTASSNSTASPFGYHSDQIYIQ